MKDCCFATSVIIYLIVSEYQIIAYIGHHLSNTLWNNTSDFHKQEVTTADNKVQFQTA